MQTERKLIPFTEAVLQVGINPKTARNWLCENKFPLPVVKINSNLYIPSQAIDIFIKEKVKHSLLRMNESYLEIFKNQMLEDSKSTEQIKSATKRGPGRPPAFPRVCHGSIGGDK